MKHQRRRHGPASQPAAWLISAEVVINGGGIEAKRSAAGGGKPRRLFSLMAEASLGLAYLAFSGISQWR